MRFSQNCFFRIVKKNYFSYRLLYIHKLYIILKLFKGPLQPAVESLLEVLYTCNCLFYINVVLILLGTQ